MATALSAAGSRNNATTRKMGTFTSAPITTAVNSATISNSMPTTYKPSGQRFNTFAKLTSHESLIPIARSSACRPSPTK